MNVTRSNRRTGLLLSLIIVGMIGLTAAAVPLYDLLCRATGWAGTPRVADAESAPQVSHDASVEVLFNADTAPGLPWSFRPVERRVDVKVGAQKLSFYEASNVGSEPVVGTAVFNVTPLKIGNYFVKVDCFCFQQQTLQPGETVQMPVSYYIDPAILDDANARDVRQITLSYTFFVDEEATEALQARSARLDAELPNKS